MAPPVWSVGQVLTASDVNTWFVPFGVFKTANTNRTSSVVTIDPDLQMNLSANAFYHVTAGICSLAGSGIGYQFGWTTPAGAGGGYGTNYNAAGIGSNNYGLQWSSTPAVVGTPGFTTSILVEGFISTSGSGTFGFNWAPNTNGSTATTGLGSVLVVERVA